MKRFAVLCLFAVLAACTTIPDGVDEFEYRMREAHLSLEELHKAVPTLGLPDGDVIVVDEYLGRIVAVMGDAIEAYRSAPDAAKVWAVVDSALGEIAKELDDMEEGARRDNVMRALAIARLPASRARIRAKLDEEYSR